MVSKEKLAKFAIGGLLAGGILAGCEKASSSVSENCNDSRVAAKISALSLDEFKTKCLAAGGEYEKHVCRTHNSCQGTSIQEGVLYENECKGHASCDGATCVGGKVAASTSIIRPEITDKKSGC